MTSIQKKQQQFRWANPREWLEWSARKWDAERYQNEFWLLVSKLDFDQLQDEYQNCMNEDKYFEPLPERTPELTPEFRDSRTHPHPTKENTP